MKQWQLIKRGVVAMLCATVGGLTGAAGAGAAVWTPAQVLHAGGGPQVGLAADGTAIAIFTGPNNAVLTTQGPVGGSFGPVHALALRGRRITREPGARLAVDARGDAVAALVEAAFGGADPVFAATRGSGGDFGALEQVAPVSALNNTDRIRVAAGGGRVAVAWTDEYAPNRHTPEGVYVAVAPAGGHFSAPVLVAGADRRNHRRSVDGAVAVTAAGDAVVTWVQGSTVYARTLSARGRLGHVLRLSSEEGSQPAPVAAGHAVAVAWRKVTSGDGRVELALISGQRVMRRAEIRTPDSAAAFAWRPQVAADASGDVLVAYTAYRTATPSQTDSSFTNSGGRLWVARWQRSGLAGLQALTGPGSQVLDVVPSLAAGGAALVAFNQGAAGTGSGSAQLRQAGVATGTLASGFGAPVTVSGSDDVNFNGAVQGAIASSGQAIVLWSVQDGGVLYATGS